MVANVFSRQLPEVHPILLSKSVAELGIGTYTEIKTMPTVPTRVFTVTNRQ